MLSIFFIIAGVFIALSALLYIFQERLIYFPSKDVTMTPKDISLEFDDIYLTASDGTKINAWFIPAKNPRATILFCHGNAGNLSHRLGTIKIFHDLSLNVLIFDYRGYGNSEGSVSEHGSYLDAKAAWDCLTNEKKIPQEQIIIAGRSLGGAVASHLAQDKKPAGFILESAFMSIAEMGKDIYPYLPARLLTRIKLKTNTHIKKIHCPKLILHSPDDEIIKFRHGTSNFKAAPEPKKFVELNGSHNDCYFASETLYRKELDDFIKRCLKK